jgi:competence protein ComEA
MLSSLLLRLVMVAVTMATVCWIGWTIPASRDAQPLHAQGPLEGDRAASLLVPPATPQASVTLPPQRQGQALSRPPAPVRLDLNRATEEDLKGLPGIGPVLARRIVQYRETQGTFRDVEQLRHVKGLGKKTLERIRALVAVVPPPAARPMRKTA